MNLTEKQKQVLTIGLIFAVLLLAGTIYAQFMIFADQKATAIAERTRLEKDIRDTTANIERMQRFIDDREAYEQVSADVERFKRRLPSDPQAIQFLEVLQDSLRKTGVAATRIARESTVQRSMYSEIPYAVRGAARYHEFGQFMNLIECHPDRFMRISEFNLTNNDRRPSVHPMSVRISTFMLRN